MTLKANRRSRKVTISDVATDAGVSRAAVSKVMRNAYGVSDDMRRNVLSSIEKLGYRPSKAARGMRGQTYTIGVLLVNMGNLFLAGLHDSISAALRAEGYEVLIGIGEAKDQIELSLIESMIAANMDGLILIAPRISGGILVEISQRIPIVAVGHYEDGAETFDTVNSDDQLGARMAVDAFIARGHKNIAMLSLAQTHAGATNVFCYREKGYCQAMKDAGLGSHAQVIRFPDLAFHPELLAAALKQVPRPTALFCWSDVHAVETISYLKTSGLRVPEDIAIIGYDNSPPAGMSLIDLSSIDQNTASIGREAAKLLLSRIKGESHANHILIPPNLVVRGSH